MTRSRLLYVIAFYLCTPVIVIWLHAVSVGESLAAVPLVRALQEQYPDYRLMVTCMTPTGSERIKAAFGTDVDHSYAPYDLPGSINRFLARVQPKLLIRLCRRQDSGNHCKCQIVCQICCRLRKGRVTFQTDVAVNKYRSCSTQR